MKHSLPDGLHVPQSNQGGIERNVSTRAPSLCTSRNRTKVGLKELFPGAGRVRLPGRNRTKVGLKVPAPERHRLTHLSRNRTKVGLKGRRGSWPAAALSGRNRTKVGLKEAADHL